MCVDRYFRARGMKWSEAHVGEINKQACLLRLAKHASEAGETKRILGERSRSRQLQRYATADF